MKAFLLSLAFAAAPLGLAAANPTTIKIPVTSADLKTEESLAALLARVEQGAKSFCALEEKDLLLVARAESTCKEDVMREAIFNAKIDPLSYYYATKSGEQAPRAVSPTLASR